MKEECSLELKDFFDKVDALLKKTQGDYLNDLYKNKDNEASNLHHSEQDSTHETSLYTAHVPDDISCPT